MASDNSFTDAFEPTSDESHLDPRSSEEWEEVRRNGYQLVDLMIRKYQGESEAPCWQPVPKGKLPEMRENPTSEGLGLSRAMSRATRIVFPYGTGNTHPKFWGWVMGAGNIPGILGSWMATLMNTNTFGGEQGLVLIEQQVLGWFRKWLGFPQNSSGLLLEGCSTANLLALAAARHKATEGKVRRKGPEACLGLRIYASATCHNSIVKAAEILGLGSDAVRHIPTLADDVIDLEAIEQAIQADLAAGLRPFCLVGNAGTVGTGSLEPLLKMRALADRYQLWFHVDGAIGAIACLSNSLRPRFEGIETADSVAFDLHKWAQIPYDAGCLLIRDGALHKQAFQSSAAYLRPVDGGLTPRGSHVFSNYAHTLSRGDRALKIWMTFISLGTKRIASIFEKNVAQADWLGKKVTEHHCLELLAPVSLNIVCFRYINSTATTIDLDKCNEKILVELQVSGFCVISTYRINDKSCLRVSIANHRTKKVDLENFLHKVIELGEKFSAL